MRAKQHASTGHNKRAGVNLRPGFLFGALPIQQTVNVLVLQLQSLPFALALDQLGLVKAHRVSGLDDFCWFELVVYRVIEKDSISGFGERLDQPGAIVVIHGLQSRIFENRTFPKLKAPLSQEQSCLLELVVSEELLDVHADALLSVLVHP